MTKIKLCGMRRAEDIRIINRYLPDYCGFILSRPFKRYVSFEELNRIRPLIDKRIRVCGVFVDETMEYILNFIKAGIIDIIQLHGDEDEEYTDKLSERLTELNKEILIIKAFRIQSDEDIRRAKESRAGLILLDSGQGSGKSFDWSLIDKMGRDFILAGGLNEENIAAAIRKHSPYAVDVSSGAETDGYKDEEKIKNIIREVRNV
ncbi:MAG: phosphoribosylanthranilate isomerase [Lachnospiraceae bacterium]|nr:phosphoribosylanthranilate isomerase [Lachnospiraceae bacterium]